MYIPRKIDEFSTWLSNNGADDSLLSWADDRSFPNFWTACPRGDWMIWILTRIDYKLSYFELKDYFNNTELLFKNLKGLNSKNYMSTNVWLLTEAKLLKNIIPWSKISE